MDNTQSTKTLLVQRKLTRAVGQVLSEQMDSYVATLAPLFRPKLMLGVHVQGIGGDLARSADQAFKELQGLYAKIATAQPFLLPPDLESPVMQMMTSLELAPWEYAHVARAGNESKTVTITRPFKWILTYAGYGPARLRRMLADDARASGELLACVLHYLVLHLIVTRSPGVAQLFETLHFPLTTAHLDELGGLPITTIGATIGTRLPGDHMIIESTELSGTDTFEELVDEADVAKLRDPLKERLLAVIEAAR
jgi:hypothetical protein